MNNHQNTLSRIVEVINKGQSGVIIIPSNATADAVAAATSLYLGLIKIGKNVALASSQKPEFDLVGVEKFQNTISAGGDSLMISFPYVEGAIDKVDYNIQGENFNLIITPRVGFPKLDPSKVSYSYTGGVVDFIVVIDAPTLNSLGAIYTDNQQQFVGREIINIDRHLTNTYYGTVNFIDKTISSVSELILKILQILKVEMDKDIATNLYAGIAASTNNFTSYSTNANTFENIAFLLRSGAIKKVIRKPTSVAPSVSAAPSFVKPQPMVNSFSVTSETQPTPIEKVEIEKQPTQSQFEQNPQNPLRPKIFKGSGLI
ncbi:MAG: DHH family phosphoesterase [Microgenomates group bacterium]